MMQYAVTELLAGEHIDVGEAKMHLRTLTGETVEDEAIIRPLIAAAREYCENITGRALARQRVRAWPEGFAAVLRLPRPPVMEIEAIRYADTNGEWRAMDAGNYRLDGAGEHVSFAQLPRLSVEAVNPIEIEYVAGMEAIPSLIRQAELLLIGHWYANREAVATGAVAAVEVDMTTRALLRQYKAWWF